ncbi:MAG: 4-hydroxy-tetrahydrodipicolinate synthase [Candidatus Helarchaeales archaeon]
MIELKGSLVALITPMDDDGNIDFETLGKLLDFQMKNGTNGLVPCGTTGESATMSHEEHKTVIKFVIDHAKENAAKFGRKFGEDLVIVAGTGSNSTKEAIELTQYAKDVGAHATLVISPYYNKPTQEGLIKHFKMLAEAVDIPIVMYNVPGRTGRNIEWKTTVELSKIENIVGIKEASGNMSQIMKIIQYTRKSGFIVLSGDDGLTLPLMAAGGKGVISVAANVVPNKMVELTQALLNQDYDTARDINYYLNDIFDVEFIETNPGPVKFMAKLIGLTKNCYLRPPMVPPKKENQKIIENVLKNLNII